MVSEQSAAPPRDATSGRRQAPGHGSPVTRLWRSVTLFISQILDELRKVVRPTRSELTTYTSVVIAFVSIIMLLVFGLDSVVTRLVFWVFAGT